MRFVLLSVAVPLLCCIVSCGTPEKSDPVVARMENYLNAMERIGFSGAVLVELDGKPVLSRGYGYRNRERKLKNAPTTVFDIGSITKQFTATAILKLEMDGKLSVSDSLAKYFPDVPADKAAITIHDLLRHQSGLPGNVGRDFDAVTEADFVKLVFGSPLRFKTGTDFGYSNIGYSLLALIVQKVSRKSYEEYAYENLWKPAGMESTGYSRPDFDPESVAIVYSREDSVWGKPTEMKWDRTAPYWHLAGNGGVLSTTEDLYKWHRALLGDRILSKEARRKLYNPTIRKNEDRERFYAYGWDVSVTERGTRLVAHNGANGFLYAEFRRFIDEGVAIIMLSNKSHPDFDIVNRELARIVFEPEYTPGIPSPDTRANRDFTDRMVRVILEQDSARAFETYEARPRGVELLDYRIRDDAFYRLFETGESAQAVALLEFNAAIHKRSAPALQDLAEAYMETGKREAAIRYFRKSLAFDPHSRFAKNMIAKLEAGK